MLYKCIHELECNEHSTLELDYAKYEGHSLSFRTGAVTFPYFHLPFVVDINDIIIMSTNPVKYH